MLERFLGAKDSPGPKGYLGTIEAGEKYQRFIRSEAANAIGRIGIARINRQEVTRVGADVPSEWAGELIMKQIGRLVEIGDEINDDDGFDAINPNPAYYNHRASLERTKEFNHPDDPSNPAVEYPQGIRLVFDHDAEQPPWPPGSAA